MSSSMALKLLLARKLFQWGENLVHRMTAESDRDQAIAQLEESVRRLREHRRNQ